MLIRYFYSQLRWRTPSGYSFFLLFEMFQPLMCYSFFKVKTIYITRWDEWWMDFKRHGFINLDNDLKNKI